MNNKQNNYLTISIYHDFLNMSTIILYRDFFCTNNINSRLDKHLLLL